MRLARLLPILLLAFALCVGCRKSPPLAPEAPGPDQTSYVGIADFNGPTNVLIVFQADSTSTLTGSITYLSQTSAFMDLQSDSASDSLRFNYLRDNVTYRAWALEMSFGIEVHITEPDGISPFQVNLELEGHNMTGLWTGEMSSTALQGQRPATMTMTQIGPAFSGSAQVNFFEAWQFDFAAGVSSANAFELTGTVYGSDSYPAIWRGSYVGFDSISGTWDVGDQSEIDGGEFLFTRSFR